MGDQLANNPEANIHTVAASKPPPSTFKEVETRKHSFSDRFQALLDIAVDHASIVNLSVILVTASALMSITLLLTPVSSDLRGLVQMVETAGALERVALWQRSVLELFGISTNAQFPSISTTAEAWLIRATYICMYAVQIVAFALALRSEGTSFMKWLIGPLAAHITMILMPPSNADVFFYGMTGDLARTGINPYDHKLAEFPNNPFLPYNHWVDMSAVYGPVWTRVNQAIISTTGPDPVLAAMAFKFILGVAAIALAVLIWWFVSHLTGQPTLGVAAGVLVAWQPNLIVETSGLAHNDPVVLLLSTSGIILAILGGATAVRGGLILVTFSSLVKYVSLPLLGLLGLTRLSYRRKRGFPGRLLRDWTLDGFAIASVMIATFLPFWTGIKTIREMVSEPGRLFSSPLYLYPKVGLEHLASKELANLFERITSLVVQVGSIAIVLATVVWFGRSIWREPNSNDVFGFPSWTRPLLIGWTVIVTTLAMLPVNAHPWYWTWPIVPIAVLGCYQVAFNGVGVSRQRAIPGWIWLYLTVTGAMTIAYHTRIVHP